MLETSMNALRWTSTLLAGLLTIACASRPAESPESQLPRYSPAEAALFDDTLAWPSTRAAAPLTLRNNAKLIERTHRSDSVFLGKVVTLASPSSQAASPRSFTVRAIEPIAGEVPSADIVLSLPSAPASPRVAENRLLGRSFIFFVKSYWGESGVEAHFRAEPDSPDVRSVVDQAAKTLD
jgi:hypothetical protein